MLNTYHVSVTLHEDPPGHAEPVWLNAVVVCEHNHDDEAADFVRHFFEEHGIHTDIAHVWEVA